MTETAQPRANRDGHPCPPWCETDHGEYDFHAAGRINVPAPEYYIIHVRAIQFPVPGRPAVQVMGMGMFSVPFADAEDLALMVDQLAGATPEQHRALAAAVRLAAAQITDGRNG